MKKLFIYVLIIIFLSEGLCVLFWPEYRRDYMTIDSRGNRVNRSNYKNKIYSDKTKNGFSWIITNKDGQRIAPQQRKSNENDYLIYWYGDSLSFGLHIDYEKTFVHLLEKNINDLNPNRSIRIINCSVVSSNISELFEVFKNTCPPKNADLVIVQPTVYDTLGSFALFSGEVLGPDAQLAMFLYQCYPPFLETELSWNSETKVINFRGLRKKYATLYGSYYGAWLPLYTLSTLVRKFEHNHISRYKFKCRHQYFPFLFDGKFIKIFKDFQNHFQLEPVEVPSLKPSLKILFDWKGQVNEIGARFLVFNLPNARGLSLAESRINNLSRQLITKRFPGRPLDVLHEYRTLYLNYLNRLQNKNIDSMEFMKELDPFEITAIFLDNDNHYNEKGHQVLADITAPRLLKIVEKGPE